MDNLNAIDKKEIAKICKNRLELLLDKKVILKIPNDIVEDLEHGVKNQGLLRQEVTDRLSTGFLDLPKNVIIIKKGKNKWILKTPKVKYLLQSNNKYLYVVYPGDVTKLKRFNESEIKGMLIAEVMTLDEAIDVINMFRQKVRIDGFEPVEDFIEKYDGSHRLAMQKLEKRIERYAEHVTELWEDMKEEAKNRKKKGSIKGLFN